MKVEREQARFRHLYRCFPSDDFPCLTMLVLLQLGQRTSSRTIVSIWRKGTYFILS